MKATNKITGKVYEYPTSQFLNDAFPYALGYWQGRACGNFENGTYENMNDFHKNLFKLGYDAGVADYAEMDTVDYTEEVKLYDEAGNYMGMMGGHEVQK